MAEKNDAPLGVNETLRFAAGVHLKRLAQEPRRFGWGDGVYEEDTGRWRRADWLCERSS